MKASIIVVTYNNLDLTRQCLESIYAKTNEPEFEIIVVDNASYDGTSIYLRRFATAHANLRVILNSVNEGFARANNTGVAAATGDHLVFLNNDTVVTLGWLSGLIRYLADPAVGMVGPVTNSSGNETLIEVNYHDLGEMEIFAQEYTRSHQGQAFEIDMLPFFCLAMRRAVFEEIGPLDERFGTGMFEDDDYALRVKQKRYKILCAEDVFVHHSGAASFSRLNQMEYLRLFLENRKKFEAKWGVEWRAHAYRPPLIHKQIGQLVNTAIDRTMQVADLQIEVQTLRAQSEDITRSTGWKLLLILWRIRLWIAPHGSTREKLGRAFFRIIRSASQWLLPRFAQLSAKLKPRVRVVANDLAGGVERHPGLVSIILPVYNQASLLRASIESVLVQSYQNLELVIINDGSTDDVQPVLEEFVGHPKVLVLTQSNQKLPKALSTGFEFARGEFWTWTSADNLMHPDQLAKQVSFLQLHPDVAMVYADYLAIDNQGNPLSDPSFRPQNRSFPQSPEIRLPRNTESLNRIPDNFIGPCFMYRGWVGRLLGEYAPEFGCEDYDYWMRMNSLFKIMHLGTDELLYQYRVHQNTLNARAKELGIQERVQKLMEYDTERQFFFQKPWIIYADAWALPWLRQHSSDRRITLKRIKGKIVNKPADKVIFLVHATSLSELTRQEQLSNSCVVVWFDPDNTTPYLHHEELSQIADICFASDRLTFDRLCLLHPRVFQVAPGSVLLDLALSWGSNHLFYRLKYPLEIRRRSLPDVFVPSSRRIRILLQVDDFGQGGLEQVVLDLASSLRSEHFEVFLLILGQQGIAVSKLVQAGIAVLTLPEDQRGKSYRALLTEKQIDLINAHFSLFGADTASELNIPFVQTIHNTYVWLTPEEVDTLRKCDQFTTAYVCVSHNVAFYSDVRLGLPPSKMVIIPNGIDLERFSALDAGAERQRLRRELGLHTDDFVFLNVGAIRPPKAQRAIVKALADVISSCPNARIVFAGKVVDESYLDLIKNDIESNGIGNAVIFAGYHEDIVPFYLMADAFVLPSLWEGWSLSLAEALYAKLAIIATDVGAAKELRTKSGYQIIPPPFAKIDDLDLSNMWHYIEKAHTDSVHDLANAMERTYQNPGESNMPNAVEKLDYRLAYQGYARLFRWLVQRGDPAMARVWSRETFGSSK